MAGQVWGTDADGGYMYSDELSDFLRTELQPLSRFRQFCDIKEGKGTGKGEKFNWNIYSDVETDGDALDESHAMPETKFSITQGTLTVTEYGNSVPYTKKLDDLSRHPVREVINKVLKHDARKTLDRAAYAQFASSRVTLAPTGGTSTTSVASQAGAVGAESLITNNAAMSIDHVKAIADLMKEREITPYMGDDYFSLARPTTLRPFKNELEQIHQYVESGMQLIFNGETGRYEGIRFVEQTNVASKGWTNAKSDEAFFFGADTVAEAIVEPEQVRGKIPTDFGRSRGLAWYYLGGFGISHNSAGGAQNRILKWSSAA
jgi:N4-gp56 family major capsid protein